MLVSDLTFPKERPFYRTYIELIGEVPLLEMLGRQLQNFPRFLESIPEDKLQFAYAEDKWTVAESLLHITDTERVFQHRALRFSRGDTTHLPGFDQHVYAAGSNAGIRSKESLIEEYKIVRQATLSLFGHLDNDALQRTGIASDLEWSVGALGFVICGHQRHHRNILRERYL